MEVLIINSPLFRFQQELYDEDSLPPIGLGYIATHLKQNGIEVTLLDAVEERIPLDNLIERANSIKASYVGVNVFSTNLSLVKDLVEGINYNAHIVIGGLSTKELFEQILTWKTELPIDIVTGDGELIFLDIVKGNVLDTPCVAVGNRRVFVIDQDSNYLVKDISDVSLDRSFFVNEPVNHPLGFYEANIVTSRGCVYNCTFCAAARSLNKSYPVRERSVKSIADELKEIKSLYSHVTSIRVLDDLFLKSKSSIEKAVSIFENQGLHWRSMAHVQTFRDADSQLLHELYKTGCKELFIGIESGSPKILEQINKTKSTDVIISSMNKLFEAGINVKGYFIYGFPNEDISDMEQTYQLAKQLKSLAQLSNVNFRTSVFQYRPYHGTAIYHDLNSSGLIKEVEQVTPNQELSHLIGRYQFNFHSGNFSNASYNEVEDYICRTLNLNDGTIFSNLSSKDTLQNV